MRRFEFALALAALLVLSLGQSNAGKLSDKLAIGISGNTQILLGDSHTGSFVFGGNPFSLRYNFETHAYVETDIGFSQLLTRVNGVDMDFELINIGMKLGRRFYPEFRFNPLAYVAVGAFNFSSGGDSRFWDAYLGGGVGIEYFFNRLFSLTATGDYRYTSGDGFDGSSVEQGKDAFLNLGVGLSYYIGRQSKNVLVTEDERAPMETIAISHQTEEELSLLELQRIELLHAKERKQTEVRLLRLKLESLNEKVQEVQGVVDNPSTGKGDPLYSRSGAADESLVGKFRSGLAFYEAEYYDNAVESFEALVAESPDHPKAGHWWYWLGESYFHGGDFISSAKAFEMATAATSAHTNLETAQFMLAMSYWNSGQSDKAQSQLDALLASNPESRYKGLAADYLAMIDASQINH